MYVMLLHVIIQSKCFSPANI